MPFDPPGHGNHAAFVRKVEERWTFYREQRQELLRESLEHWDLYLTRKQEFRAKGEEWRANLALPDAYANIEAKVANLVAIMLSADPPVQPEGVQDSHMDTARSIERILDYTYRKNAFSKFITKMTRMRAVAGTAFFKLTWVEQAHTITLSRDERAVAAYTQQLAEIGQLPALTPAPDWITEPEAFEAWRKTVNDADYAKVPAPPLEGPQRIITFRGPKFHLLPLSAIYLDPLIDEMGAQDFVVHRVVRTQDWLADRVADGLYDETAVAHAMGGWDGRVVEDEEVELASKMGLLTDNSASADPRYRKAVELWEVWQPGALYPYALVLNRRAVINKMPTELPFLHGDIGVGATRATVVPGHFYGMSDLRPPRDLFWEKRKLRNLRVDAVTLNVLPAYLKLKEVGLPEMMHKIRPGALIPASRPDAIQPLTRDPLPPEAYREPEDMDAGIADAMGIYGATKGRDAPIGRVTGTEFQGRENRAQIRIKLDSIFLEEDLYPLNRQIIGLYAQMGDDPLIVRTGGEPNPLTEVSRAELMEAMDMQWRFRGPNKAINRDMQVQQLLMWVRTFGSQLTPAEYRYSARLILELLDIRGIETLVSQDGTATKVREYEAAAAVAQAQQAMTLRQAQMGNTAVPPEVQQATAEQQAAQAQAAQQQEGGQ